MFENDYGRIMTDAKGKAKTNISGKLQDVVTIYDVFIGAGTYLAPEIAIYCSKTATEVAYYILRHLGFNETTIEFTAKEAISSGLVNAKTPNRVRDAIKELIDFGVMIAWKDIDKIKKYNVEVNSHTYLLNPLLIRRCSARSYKRNCEVTKDKFNNGKVVFIREQDAMVYNFSKMIKLNLPNLENVNLEIEL